MFMSNESVFLPAAVRDRIWDLLKERKVTQAELAARIGCSESSLSRFISGKTDKLGDENIIRIARAFDVSTDFLLGEVDEPDRKNYDISELGLSVEAARNLYTQKVNPKIVSCLLENPQFADTTYQIARYLDNELTSGFAAQTLSAPRHAARRRSGCLPDLLHRRCSTDLPACRGRGSRRCRHPLRQRCRSSQRRSGAYRFHVSGHSNSQRGRYRP